MALNTVRAALYSWSTGVSNTPPNRDLNCRMADAAIMGGLLRCDSILASEKLPVHYPGDHNGELVRFDRFCDVHLETGRDGALSVLRSSVCRECHCGDVNAALLVFPFADAPQQAIAIFVRHAEVGHHHIGSLLHISDHREGFSGGARGDNVCAVLSNHGLEQFARLILVLNDTSA